MNVTLNVPPKPKPRMTRADRWKKRPVILAYWEWCAEVRAQWGDRAFPEHGAHITFRVPMPKSWSRKKREAMTNTGHRQTPDLDNYLKALLDAIHADDCAVWDFDGLCKVWTDGPGCIEVQWPT